MEQTTPTARPARLYGIDELRGVAMILVLVYHFLWALNLNGYGVNPEAMPQRLIGYGGAFLFLLIAGASCTLTRHPYRRALIILGASTLVFAATSLTHFVEPINFGVLQFLGVCSLLYALLRKPLAKCDPRIGLPLMLALLVVCWKIPSGRIFGWRLPSVLYSTRWLFWLGFPANSYSAGDYYPLLPWIFLFFAGYFLMRLPRNPPAVLTRSHCRPLAFVGRHTLPIYLVHQPLFFGLLWLLRSL